MDRLASMETFVRVVETGSFSGAARQLGVGQPAVSKSVAQLEEYLGVKLLTRSTRGLTRRRPGSVISSVPGAPSRKPPKPSSPRAEPAPD